MKVPMAFDLLGRKVDVIFDNEKCAKENALGLCDSDFSKIYLADTHKGVYLPEQVVSQNFLHEAVHAILDAMGETKLSANEKFVDLFAGLFHQMLDTSLYTHSLEELEMIVKIKRSQHISFHLQVMKGFTELTEKEMNILAEFIKEHEVLSTQISNPELLNAQLFSSNSRKRIRNTLGISSENLFNNYVGSLKSKGVIEKTATSYKISEKMFPQQKLTFEIEFTD